FTTTASSDSLYVTVLKRAFSMFDSTKSGRIEKEKVRTILNTLGHTFDDHDLELLLKQEDNDGSGKLNFDSFYRVASHFQEEDDEALLKELKEAFRLYDKEGNGYIPTSSLREILAALDDQITPDQMDGMIAEIDTDGSGTVDFDGEHLISLTGHSSSSSSKTLLPHLTEAVAPWSLHRNGLITSDTFSPTKVPRNGGEVTMLIVRGFC
ncbi:Troponin C, partial [Habropoda laboriosa]